MTGNGDPRPRFAGRKPKAKGRVYEREFRKRTGAKRVIASGAYGHLVDNDDLSADAVLDSNEAHRKLRVEVKYRARGVAFGQFLKPPVDLVAVRTAGKQWYVVLTLDRFMEVYDGSGLVPSTAH